MTSAAHHKPHLTLAQSVDSNSSSPVSSAPSAARRGRADDEKEQHKGLCRSRHSVRLDKCGFTVIAFAAQIIIWKTAFGRGESLKSKFLGFPMIHIGIVYLVAQILVLAVFLYFPALPPWSSVVVCTVIAGIAAICMIAVAAGCSEIRRVEEKVEKTRQNQRGEDNGAGS